MVPVGAKPLLESTLTMVQARMVKQGLTLKLSAASEIGQVVLDPRKVKQIIYNLLDNAAKFAGSHGIIELVAHRCACPTIAEPDVQRLFEPFVQLKESYSRSLDGSGLGLSLVRRFAELHGDTVGLASAIGRGSRFYVWLPYRTAA
jgi:signal transduction histidine kinase